MLPGRCEPGREIVRATLTQAPVRGDQEGRAANPEDLGRDQGALRNRLAASRRGLREVCGQPAEQRLARLLRIASGPNACIDNRRRRYALHRRTTSGH
jgi:hypothetical protein